MFAGVLQKGLHLVAMRAPNRGAVGSLGIWWGRATAVRGTIHATAIVALALIVPFVATCAYLGHRWTRWEEARAVAQMANLADAAADDVARFVDGRIAILTALATSPALDRGDLVAFAAQARELFDHEGIGAVLRDSSGLVLVDTMALPDAGHGSPANGAMIAGEAPRVSDLIDRDPGRSPVVIIDVPVTRGNVARFSLSAIVRPVAFNDLIRRSGLGDDLRSLLVDREGRIIGRSSGAELQVGQMLPDFRGRTGPAGPWSGASPNGVPLHAFYRRLPDIGWMVTVAMTEATLGNASRRFLLALGALTLALVVGAAALTFPVIRRVYVARRNLDDTLGLLRLAQDAAGAGVWELDAGTGTARLSPAGARLMGCGSDTDEATVLSLEAWQTLVWPEDRPGLEPHWIRALGVGVDFTAEFRVGRADASVPIRWLQVFGRSVVDERTGRVIRVVGQLMDITAHKESERRIRHMALHDALTGLPNRNLFRQRLDETMAQALDVPDRYAVLALDLDRFKAVNDTYGHVAGDRLLCLAAERIRTAVRESDTVVRLGGDEFAVILADMDGASETGRICDRIIGAVNEPMMLDGVAIDVGVSMGAALLSSDGASAEELFKRADAALYAAKAAGRNTYRMFEAEAHARGAVRSILALDLKEAIRRGDFHLVYQPIVDVVSDRVASFEALMRWRHPERGLIPPSEFIPVAEETGLITQLGAWALNEGCREARNWPEAVRVSINVSVVQFSGGLEQVVLAALASSGLPADRLKLEVTESVLMQDAEAALAMLHRIRRLGVRIVLDDFGTGYSSLSYLRRFPFDKLKIDRAFISDIADPDAAAIVRAVVHIGERLGMGIVAEGVETAEQLAAVRREGCTEVQGYFFSRPLDAAGARAFVTANGSRAA